MEEPLAPSGRRAGRRATEPVNVEVSGDEAVFGCAESGRGIQPATLLQIFIACEPASVDSQQRFGSLGLGLDIALGLVAGHGKRGFAGGGGGPATFAPV